MKNNVVTRKPDGTRTFNKFVNMLRQLEGNSQNNNQPQRNEAKETSLLTTNISGKEQLLTEEETIQLRGPLPWNSEPLELPGFWKSKAVSWFEKAEDLFQKNGMTENNMKFDYIVST